MSPIKRTAIILFATCALSLTSIVFIGIAHILLVDQRPLSDFLPAESTVAFFEDVKLQDLTSWHAAFPELSSIAPYKEPVSIAIMQGEKEQREFAVFAQSQSNTMYGRFGVVQSSSGALNLLKHRRYNPLTSEYAYSTLQSLHQSSKPWVTLHTSTVQDSSLLSRLLLGNSTHIAMELGHTEDIVIHRLVHTPRSEGARSLPHIESAILNSASANLHPLFTEWSQHLSKEDNTLLDTLLHTYAHHYVGEGVSVRNTVLPALAQKPHIVLQTNASGSLVTSVGVQSEDTEEVAAMLHESFADSLPHMRMTKRILDKRFSATDIRKDSTVVHTEISKIDGWTVQRTLHEADTRSLHTARKGNWIYASTAQEGIDSLLGAKEKLLTPRPNLPSLTPTTLLAGGFIDIPSLFSLTQDILHRNISYTGNVPIPEELFRAVRFSLTGHGHIETLMIQP